MNSVVSLMPERIEIGRVTGNGDREWMMMVIDEADGPEPIDSGFYLTVEGAVTAARGWGFPIVFVRETGAVEVVA